MDRAAVVLDVAPAARPARPPQPARRRLRWPRWATPLALAALCVWSVTLRTGVMDAGFWIDEGLSVGIADRPLADIPGALRLDGSPPLYYMVLHVWMAVAGRSEETTHLLSLIFAVACVPLTWWLTRAPLGARAAWLAAGGAAAIPFLTQYAQETRMYSLVVLLGILATGAFLRAFVERRGRWWAVFAGALVLQLYTHNWALFFAAGTGLAWLALVGLAPGAERRSVLRDGVLAFGLVALAYLPWVPTLIFQAGHTGAPWARAPGFDLWVDAFGRLLGMDAQHVLLFCAGAGLLALARPARHGLRRLDRDGRAAVALVVMALATLTIAWLASQVSPAWALRYLAVCVAPLLALAALGLARARMLGLAGAAVVALMWAADEPPAEKSNVRAITGLIEPSISPGDLVVSTQPEQIPVLSYYLPDGLRYATVWGPVEELGVTDWRDGVERLEGTSAERDFLPLIEAMRPGQRLVLVEPIIFALERWYAPWTRLVRYRSMEWARAADADPRLRPIMRRPVVFRPPAPNPVRATVYERVARSPGA